MMAQGSADNQGYCSCHGQGQEINKMCLTGPSDFRRRELLVNGPKKLPQI